MMWQWINGAGAPLKQPLKNSTNYLGAYDKFGRLIRALDQDSQQSSRPKGEDGDASAADGKSADSTEAKKETHEADRTPKETLEDLRPFPQNPFFRSEAVLSDPLKDEIYRRVTAQGQTVREVSMALHVEMSRVAAVVRLKTIEQEWRRQVSSSISTHHLPPAPCTMMRQHKIYSISLQDTQTGSKQHSDSLFPPLTILSHPIRLSRH